jgi:hypothetical protein
MRAATEVFEDHLNKRLAGKVKEDITNNYSEKIILLTGTGIFIGHKGVSESADELNQNIPDARFSYKHTLVKKGYAFLEWTADSLHGKVSDGADSFVISEGKIIFQSVHYTVTKK